ncbi:hypothetical protein D3C81_978350 [compost metagenome]
MVFQARVEFHGHAGLALRRRQPRRAEMLAIAGGHLSHQLLEGGGGQCRLGDTIGRILLAIEGREECVEVSRDERIVADEGGQRREQVGPRRRGQPGRLLRHVEHDTDVHGILRRLAIGIAEAVIPLGQLGRLQAVGGQAHAAGLRRGGRGGGLPVDCGRDGQGAVQHGDILRAIAQRYLERTGDEQQPLALRVVFDAGHELLVEFHVRDLIAQVQRHVGLAFDILRDEVE